MPKYVSGTLVKRIRWGLQRNPERKIADIGVIFGRRCRFIRPSRTVFGSEPYLIKLGDHVTVGEGVRFITHDGGVWVLRDKNPDLDRISPIIVGDNVFIGSRAILLPGVSVGSNVIIAAGSIVTRSIPSDVVVAGVPARVVSDLDQYESRAIVDGVATKGMDPRAKRDFLLDLFADQLSRDA